METIKNNDTMTTRIETLAAIADKERLNNQASGKVKKAAYKSLMDETLYVLSFGGLKAENHVRKMFGKEGKFNSFTSMLGDCSGLVRVLKTSEEKAFSFKQGDNQVVVSLEKIKAFGESQEADKALDFSGRNAWKKYQEIQPKGEEKENALSLEDQAIQAYANAEQMTVESLADSLNIPENKTEIVNQGLAILAEQEKAALEEQAAFIQAETRRLYAMLSHSDKLAFYNEIKQENESVIRNNAVARSEDRKTA